MSAFFPDPVKLKEEREAQATSPLKRALLEMGATRLAASIRNLNTRGQTYANVVVHLFAPRPETLSEAEVRKLLDLGVTSLGVIKTLLTYEDVRNFLTEELGKNTTPYTIEQFTKDEYGHGFKISWA